MDRDLQSKIKVVGHAKILTKLTGDKITYSSSVDTKDMKSLMYAGVCIKSTDGSDYTPSDYDDVDITVQESADDIVFTDVDPVQKQLGVSKIGTKLFKVGAVSTKQYVRLKVKCNTLETLTTGQLILEGVLLAEGLINPQA